MTGPVWDGRGADPWLPSRLGARSEVAVTEREIRRSFWSALSGWLVETGRRVLRGSNRPPDLDAIWARVPAWREAVEQVVQGDIRDAMGTAYRATLGPEASWSQRPFVASYLAQVENRLVRLPDEVYDLVAHEVASGAGAGEPISEIADRVDTVLSTTRSERWPNRAVVVARTETIGALNAGRHDSFGIVAEEEPDTPLERLWLATSDSRTRRTHGRGFRLPTGEWANGADGQRVPIGKPFVVGGFELMFPGDPSGPPQEVIACRCTSLLVEPGELADLTDYRSRRSR